MLVMFADGPRRRIDAGPIRRDEDTAVRHTQ
ncbi:MAG: hypothetical protein ACJAXW_002450, partial [Candidatus Azotimanducaceae bacterium]